MGLAKKLVLPNGVPVEYHRIVTLTVVTNVQNIVEVASYTSYEKRQEDKAIREAGQLSEVFTHTVFYNADYDPEMNVSSAYNWLKTLDEFENAEDVVEEDPDAPAEGSSTGQQNITEGE